MGRREADVREDTSSMMMDLRMKRDDKDVPVAESDDGSIEIRLVGVNSRRGVVPVVRFANEGRRAKTVQQYVAWMLQTVIGAGSRVDTLYDFVEHPDLVEGAREVGVAPQDVLIAQLRSDKLPPYKGIGESGDRSAMFSLIVRIAMSEKELPRNFCADIEPYGLATLIKDLLRQLKVIVMRVVSTEIEVEPVRDNKRLVLAPCSRKQRATRRRGRAPSDHPASAPEIEVSVVCGCIPVVDMPNQGSMFGEHVSWLLQAAMADEGKASALMKYIENFDESREIRRAYDACASLCGLTEQDMGMVSLAGLGKTVLAVGTSGKRSSMLAAILAIAIRDECHLADIKGQIELMAPNLVKPFYDLIDVTLKLQKRDPEYEDFCADLEEQPPGGRSSSWENEAHVPVKRERGRDNHGSARGSSPRSSQRSRPASTTASSHRGGGHFGRQTVDLAQRTSRSRSRALSDFRAETEEAPAVMPHVRGHGSFKWEKNSRSRSRVLSRFMNEK